MNLFKLHIFLLCIFFSSASESVSKAEYDQEIKQIYEKLEKLDQLQYELDETRKENKILNENVQILQQENKRFQETIVSLEYGCRKLELNVNELRKERDEKQTKATLHSAMNSELENTSDDSNSLGLFGSTQQQGNISDFVSKTKADSTFNKNESRSLNKVRRLLIGSSSSSPSVIPQQNSIGFLAYNPSHQQNLGIHQTVEFPSALTNIGSAYNPSSSIFRAPVDGLYFFSVTILSFQGEDIEVEIVHNGNGMVYTYSGSETMYGSGSTSAVLQLHANDDVWIRILDIRSVNDGNVRVYKGKWSSFCGFKIA